MKNYKDVNVHEALMNRYDFIFENFDVIEVSFSGGKDSTVLVHTIMDYIKENNIKKKIILQYMDYEGSYKYTEDHLIEVYEEYIDNIYPHWNCLTYKTACGVSMFQGYWLPWNSDEKDIWVRDYPESTEFKVFNGDNHPYDFYYKGIEDSDFDLKFTKWCHQNYYREKPINNKRTINLMGVRSDESLHRYNAIIKNTTNFKNTNYIMKESKNIYHAYPLYDWVLSDVWHYLSINNKSYNKLYDMYFIANVPLHNMRVASAFIDEGVSSLKLHRAIEPNTWGKLVGRVNGANFGNIYGGTKAHGFHKISLPKGHTWKSYCEFLLSTLPEETALSFKKKFETSIRIWTEKGATVHISSIKDIQKNGVTHENLGHPKGKIYQNRTDMINIRFMEYPDDIKSKNFRELPSYKRMCISILKNDHSCKYMGYGMTNYEKELRQKALEKYKKI